MLAKRWWSASLLTLAAGIVLAACGGGGNNGGPPPLVIGGIPDQNASQLERQFTLLAGYLSEQTGLDVRYQSTVDYAAIVTAFRRGDVQLAWLGGLTGEQARAQVPDAVAIAQRLRNAAFTSVFIVRNDLHAQTLSDLEGVRFTFGSESSTSGHLMPRYFLQQAAGIDPESDFQGAANFSGSHDRTYKLVEAGAFDAGALNAAVWETAVASGAVDTRRVRVLATTSPYFDYHFTVRGDLDAVYGDGATAGIRQALLALRENGDPAITELLDLFQTDGFIPTRNENYDGIRAVAVSLGLLR